MKIHTYWWGCEMFPESDDEWEDMLSLFTDTTTIGCYECDPDHGAVYIDHGEGPAEEDRLHNERPIGIRDLRPEAVQKGLISERRCIAVQR